jgi:hypothetical protein
MRKRNKINVLTEAELQSCELFKIQIPLATNVDEGEEMALVYNESREIEFYVPVRTVAPLFKQNEHKRYIVGFVDERKKLQLFPDMPITEAKF